MLSICCFAHDSTISSSQAMRSLRYILYPNVSLRTGTKNRAAFCVKLSLLYATVYELFQNNHNISSELCCPAGAMPRRWTCHMYHASA